MNRPAPLLLFTDDGAAAADAAWAWISSHNWDGWALETISTRVSPYPAGSQVGDVIDVHRQPPSQAGFTHAKHVDVEGDPRTILTSRSDPSLVVVGVHPGGHPAGPLPGSTTEWLLGRPPVPLVAVRHGHRTRSVAVCVDGSPHSRRALQTFLTLPWSADVDLELVSVDDGTTNVEHCLAETMASFPAQRRPTAHRLVGKPKREIQRFVRSHKVDLVVLGTRGLKGFSRFTMGSTVSALVEDETANLLVAYVADGGDDLAQPLHGARSRTHGWVHPAQSLGGGDESP